MKDEIKTYKAVYIGLLILTGVTVAISYIHLGVKAAVLLALVVATFKASLVATFFMHLNHEKKAIYGLLILTVIFLVSMFVLILCAQFSVYEGLEYVS